MTISCGPFSMENQPLPCSFPPCNCERCQKSRAKDENNPLNCDTEISKEDPCERFFPKGKTKADNPAGQISKENACSNNCLADLVYQFNYNFEPENIFSVLFDVIGTIAFLIMAIFTIWLVVTIYVWRLIVTVYHAKRNSQICSLVLFTLILICIVFHAITGHRAKSLRMAKPINITPEIVPPSNPPHCAQASSKVNITSASRENLQKISHHKIPQNTCPDTSLKTSNSTVNTTSASRENLQKICNHKCPHKTCDTCDSSDLKNLNVREQGGTVCGKGKNQASESLCDLCARKFGKSSSKTSMTDEEIEKIYFNYNLASVPMEWKSPPEPIVYIMDYLQNMFGSSENSETQE